MAPRNRPSAFRDARRSALVVVATLTVLLAGCGSGTGATSTPTSPPTPTAPPLPAITPDARVLSACAGSAGSPLSVAQVQVGQFDGWQELPATLPLKPLPISTAKVIGNLALNRVTVDLTLSGGSSSAPAYLCAATFSVIAYQPLDAPIPNVTRTCSDHAYLDPGGADYGGDCGVLSAPPASAEVTLSASLVGTTLTVPVANAARPGQPASFPGADGNAHIWIALTVAEPGAYTFVVGLWQDRSGPAARAEVSERFDLNAAHEWSGQACTAADMQTQLPPPTDPPTPLLCPGPSPALTYS